MTTEKKPEHDNVLPIPEERLAPSYDEAGMKRTKGNPKVHLGPGGHHTVRDGGLEDKD